MSAPLLCIRDLEVSYPVGTARLTALCSVDLDFQAGEVMGVVGESGCGKSTLGRVVVGLVRPTAGEVHWRGRRIDQLSPEVFRPLRRELQMVFQDPFSSLDPRRTVAQSVIEPLTVFEPSLGRAELRERAERLLNRVGLSAQHMDRYPHELSGGQCQRVAIARAVILQPKLIVCDEAVSALDVSVQAQVLELLQGLQAELGIGLLFISHNLAVVRLISHRVLVLYLGRVLELAGRDALFSRPLHPYTRLLQASVPVPDPARRRRGVPAASVGEPPSPIHPPSGCVFRTRCRFASGRCAEETPALEEAGPGHWVACHRWRESELSA